MSNIENEEMKMEYKNEDCPIYYSNGIGIIPNYFDFQYTFSNQYLGGENNNLIIRKDLCKIFMSPQHAKVFSSILAQNIIEFEKRFGEIKVPEEFNLGTSVSSK